MSTAILNKSIEKLPISKALQEFMYKHQYATLGELVKEGTVKLQRREGFTVLCFENLLDILDQNDIMCLLSEGDE